MPSQNQPTNPDISGTVTAIPSGAGADLRGAFNDRIDNLANRDRIAQASVEGLCRVLGNGAVYGGTLTVGTALYVNYAPLLAICGNLIEDTLGGTIGCFPNASNYLWLRQTGDFTTGTVSDNPGTADGMGTAILWAVATTNAGSVTALDQTRHYVIGHHPWSQNRRIVDSDEWVTIGANYQVALYGTVSVSGTVTVMGYLRCM